MTYSDKSAERYTLLTTVGTAVTYGDHASAEKSFNKHVLDQPVTLSPGENSVTGDQLEGLLENDLFLRHVHNGFITGIPAGAISMPSEAEGPRGRFPGETQESYDHRMAALAGDEIHEVPHAETADDKNPDAPEAVEPVVVDPRAKLKGESKGDYAKRMATLDAQQATNTDQAANDAAFLASYDAMTPDEQDAMRAALSPAELELIANRTPKENPA